MNFSRFYPAETAFVITPVEDYLADIELQHEGSEPLIALTLRGTVHIRQLTASDLPQIINRYTFPWSTEEKTRVMWEGYWQEQCEGMRTVGLSMMI